MALYDEIKAFFNEYAPAAQKVQEKYNVPASVVLGAAALESGYGKSGLTTDYNNFFGVKGSGDAGSIGYMSPEWVNGKLENQYSEFASYSSPEASFMDYGDFLQRNPRYTKAGVFDTSDPYQVIERIAQAGYAGDNPDYAKSVSDIIRNNYLVQYDAPKKSMLESFFTVDTNDKLTRATSGYKDAISYLDKMGITPVDGVYTVPTSDDFRRSPEVKENFLLRTLSTIAQSKANDVGDMSGADMGDIRRGLGESEPLGLTGTIVRIVFIILAFGILAFIVFQVLPKPNISVGAGGSAGGE